MKKINKIKERSNLFDYLRSEIGFIYPLVHSVFALWFVFFTSTHFQENVVFVVMLIVLFFLLYVLFKNMNNLGKMLNLISSSFLFFIISFVLAIVTPICDSEFCGFIFMLEFIPLYVMPIALINVIYYIVKKRQSTI